MDDREHWIKLNACPVMNPLRFHQFLKAFGTVGQALKAGAGELSRRIPGLALDAAAQLLDFCRSFDASSELRALEKMGAKVLMFRAPDYPRSLLTTYNPPPVLYVRGSIPEDLTCLAVVGTRTPTPYGLRMTERLVDGLAKAGLGVVSGLALGIDAHAHRAAIRSGTPTAGIIGSGFRNFYPAQNGPLADEIVEAGGAVVSQFPLDAQPLPYFFPMRNAVIAGLSAGVLVIEGGEKSGALITADLALDMGRDVFALPGEADAPMSQGPLKLVQNGAKLVRNIEDILEEIPGFRLIESSWAARRTEEEKTGAEKKPVGEVVLKDLTGEEARIYRLIRENRCIHIDPLARKSGLKAGDLGSLVTLLELKGAVRQLPGAHFEAS